MSKFKTTKIVERQDEQTKQMVQVPVGTVLTLAGDELAMLKGQKAVEPYVDPVKAQAAAPVDPKSAAKGT